MWTHFLLPKAMWFPWSCKLEVVASKQRYRERVKKKSGGTGVTRPGQKETQHKTTVFKYLRGSRSRDAMRKCFLLMKALHQRTGLLVKQWVSRPWKCFPCRGDPLLGWTRSLPRSHNALAFGGLTKHTAALSSCFLKGWEEDHKGNPYLRRRLCCTCLVDGGEQDCNVSLISLMSSFSGSSPASPRLLYPLSSSSKAGWPLHLLNCLPLYLPHPNHFPTPLFLHGVVSYNFILPSSPVALSGCLFQHHW